MESYCIIMSCEKKREFNKNNNTYRYKCGIELNGMWKNAYILKVP